MKIMSQSELSADEDLSSDDDQIPAKRSRVDTLGTASTTSHDSVQESDEETPDTSYGNVKNKSCHTDQTLGRVRDSRLSRSSLSENCSSPNEPCDYYRPGFEDNEADTDAYSMTSFQMHDNSMGSRNNDPLKEMDDVYKNNYSDKAKQMMTNMGFKAGHGLGKFEHGRVDPVEASTQKGRRGLGMKPSVVGDVPRDFNWTPDTAPPEAKEEVLWMPSPPEEILSGDILEAWLKQGPKKETIDDETNFVDPDILKGVLGAKTIFDKLHDEDMRNARSRSNPYETIGSVIFLNRAAVKMANIDAVFDFMFTDPKKPNGEPALDPNDLLYFADVCAGPGGFSEYVLYRKGWRAKGKVQNHQIPKSCIIFPYYRMRSLIKRQVKKIIEFKKIQENIITAPTSTDPDWLKPASLWFGFTLKISNDFKLSDFYAGTPETFYPYYGAKEDGNVFDPANLMSLKEHVLRHTDDKGVHFLMADGGFSVEGQENIQEILSKQLYLCQCIAALMLVRTGGHFVVKLFDIFTPFSVGLIYIMYRCFERVSIHKPVTSRPANSERYLICKWKKLGTEPVEHHLFSVNSILWSALGPKNDVTELVPMEVIQGDTAFYEYIYKSNCLLGERQIKNLLKIAAFSKDRTLKEAKQAEMKTQCLALWKIPEKSRTAPPRLSHDDVLTYVLTHIKNATYRSYNTHSFKSNVLNKPPEYLDDRSKLDRFNNVYDWHFTFLTTGRNKTGALGRDLTMTMFIGCGGKQVYQLKTDNTWQIIDLNISLPAKTLLYGEIIKEYIGERTSQSFNRALHVVDAIMLGGIDISSEPLSVRVQQCALFCASLEMHQDAAIRCKKYFGMEQFPNAVCNLEYRNMKRGSRAVTIEIPKRNNTNDMFYVVGSVLFVREIREPWSAHMSKSQGCKYYYRYSKDGKSFSDYKITEEAAVDTINAYINRVMWPWDEAPSAVFESLPHRGVTRKDMEQYILCKIKT